VVCPCHLPLTLWAVGALSSGTVLAPFVLGHSLLIGTLTTAAWLSATAYGFHLVRAGRRLDGTRRRS